MKTLLLAFLVLGPTLAMTKPLVVFADIALLPDSGFTKMAKDPECGKPTESGDLYVICLGGWSRYSLTRVTRLNGTRLEDTIALIFADPELGGRWRLGLQRLDATAAAIYGASYKAISAKSANGTGARR